MRWCFAYYRHVSCSKNLMKTTSHQLLALLLMSFVFWQGCRSERTSPKASLTPDRSYWEKLVEQIREPLPPNDICYSKENCEIDECERKILRVHLIDSIEFNICVDSFIQVYRPVKLDRTGYIVDDIRAIISDLSCTKGHYVGFSKYTEDDRITLGGFKPRSSSIHPFTEPEIHGRYSIAFFNGLIDSFGLKPNDTLVFFKAIKNSRPTVALRFNVSGKEYYADLSQYYP